MFNQGDVIVYGAQGVCQIERTEIKQIGKQSAEYYVLKPLFSEGTCLFVPVDNEVLLSRMRPALTETQIHKLAEFAEKAELKDYGNEIQKREAYKNILASNDRQELVLLIKTIRTEKEIRQKSSKKLTVNDERTLYKAEQLLYNEIGYVMGVEPQEAKNIIKF